MIHSSNLKYCLDSTLLISLSSTYVNVQLLGLQERSSHSSLSKHEHVILVCYDKYNDETKKKIVFYSLLYSSLNSEGCPRKNYSININHKNGIIFWRYPVLRSREFHYSHFTEFFFNVIKHP